MKTKHILAIFIFVLFCIVFLGNGITQDDTQLNLPEGAKARLSKGEIKSISFSPDGTQIAVGSPTGVWFYDVRTGAERALLTDHVSTTGRVAFSPDGKTLASGMHDKILLWDIATGKFLKSIKRQASTIKGLRIFDDGTTLLCENDYDGSVQLWDINTGSKKKDFHPSGSRGLSAVFGSMIGREIAAVDLYLNKIEDNGIYAIGYKDGKIRLEDATTGRHLRNLQGPKERVRQLAFSPDGARLAAETANGTIRLWEVTTGRILKDLTQQSKWAWGLLMFSKGGKTLACQGKAADIELWDVETQTLRVTLDRMDTQMSMLAFSPDAKTVASANLNGEIKVWDANTGDEVSVFRTAHAAWLDALAFSADGSTLASGDIAAIRFWDTLTFTQRANTIKVRGALFGAWAFSPDGSTVTTADRFRFEKRTRDAFVKESVLSTLSLWDTRTGRRLSGFGIEWHEGEAPVLPGQKKTAMSTGGMDGPVVFSQNGYMLATALNSERATKDNRFTVHLWETPHGKLHFTLKGHTDKVNALAFTHQGHTLASASDDGTIRLWDASTGTQMLSLPSGKTRALVFSTDGKILASISGAANIQLWDIATGNKRIALKGQSSLSDALAFSMDNKILASGSRDRVILWDVPTGNKLATLKGQAYGINALAFSPDGNTLASGSEGGAIFLWHIPK